MKRHLARTVPMGETVTLTAPGLSEPITIRFNWVSKGAKCCKANVTIGAPDEVRINREGQDGEQPDLAHARPADEPGGRREA